ASQSQAMLAMEESKMAADDKYRQEVDERRKRAGVWIYPLEKGGVRPPPPPVPAEEVSPGEAPDDAVAEQV
ncbi:MAG TPA: hypothetical protein VNT60_10485, partial [Deinococcales bacterium]|nr:hypothetical protein [Deinococcales bacterium]